MVDSSTVQARAGDESDFDDLAAAAAVIADMPVGLVGLIRGGSYWFRGRVGFEQDMMPREFSSGHVAFCEEVVGEGAEFAVPDTHADPRFAEHPLVVGEPHVRSYAGFPLVLSSGALAGALCVVDTAPRELSEQQKQLLRLLARQVVAQLELRQQVQVARATAEALAESEQRLRLTIDHSPIGVALIGLDGSWLQINDAVCRIVGYPRERLMQMTFQDITHPNDLEADLALLDELRSGARSSYQLDKRYVHADGHPVWINLTASLVRQADGTPLHYVSQIKDVTARYEATAELEAERDFSAALLAALQDGYAYLERGRILVVNDAFCDMTGYTRSELVGSNAGFLVGETAAGDSRLADLINQRKDQVELPVRRRDGVSFDASIQIKPVRRPDNSIHGYIAVVRDITDGKSRERRLRHQADHDGLTGLLNRAAFHVRLKERVAGAMASRSPLSLAVIDVDRFKRVNDTYGHPAGDAVLTEFADRLRGNARGDDVLGRIGGEEFGLLLAETDLDEAVAAVGRTLDAVRRHTFPHVGRLTFSAGVAELTPLAGPWGAGEAPLDPAAGLLHRADRALYAAKSGGRDRICAALAGGSGTALSIA